MRINPTTNIPVPEPVDTESVRKDIARLLTIHPFFGMVMLKQKISVENCGTAYVDGVTLGIDPTFWGLLNQKQRLTVLAHEALHLTNLHNHRQEDRDPSLFNQACDWAINPHLMGDQFQFPEEGCVQPERLQLFRGKTAEAIYEYLKKESLNAPKPDPLQEKEDEENDPLQEKEDEEQNTCSGSEDGETSEEEGSSESKQKPTQQTESWGEVRKHPEITEENEDEIRQKAERQMKQLMNQAKAKGDLPLGLEEELDELLKPKVDWKSLLARWVEGIAQSDYSFLTPNPVHLPRFILPTLRSEAYADIAIAVDTSGSMSDEELKIAVSEILQSAQTFQENGQDMNIPVIWCDSRVHGVDYVTDAYDMLIPKGRGGTAFTPAIEKVRKLPEPPQGMIYITDGYGDDFPKNPPCEVLWLVTEPSGMEYLDPPYGEKILIGN